MSDVLVLFYDRKDKVRPAGKATLEDEIKRGFEGTDVEYDIHVASPSHTPWLARNWMNEKKYDGILIVAGLACSLSVPKARMQELYENEFINLGHHECPEIENKIVPSKYFKQERHVPILGVPTKHQQDVDGHLAFESMLMESSPSSAMCVGVEQGYQAARLMSKIVSNTFSEVKILVPYDTPSNANNDEFDGENERKYGPTFPIAKKICRMLDLEFKVWEQGNIGFGRDKIGHYEWSLETFAGGNADDKVLLVVVYDNFDQIRRVDKFAKFMIGVYAHEEPSDLNKLVYVANSLENVVHVRPGISGNAGMTIVQGLYNARNEKGKPKLNEESFFTKLRKDKSKENFEEFLLAHPELDKRHKGKVTPQA